MGKFYTIKSESKCNEDGSRYQALPDTQDRLVIGLNTPNKFNDLKVVAVSSLPRRASFSMITGDKRSHQKTRFQAANSILLRHSRREAMVTVSKSSTITTNTRDRHCQRVRTFGYSLS